jgi:hypothetical protein
MSLLSHLSSTTEQTSKLLGQLVPHQIKELERAYPFQDRLHPETGKAQRLSMEWARRYGQMGSVTLTDAHFKVIEEYLIGHLMGRCHPDTTLEKLSFITDFATWLFMYDDIVEKCTDKGLIQHRHERTLQIIERDGDADKPDDDGLMRGLSDIMGRVKAYCSPAWKARFSKDVRDYTVATLWERENRIRRRYPTVQDYKANRPFSSGTIVMFDFIEIVEGLDLPDEIFTRPDFQIVRNLGVDIVNFANDIASAPKEVDRDFHNLVFAYKNTLDIGFDQALGLASRDLKKALYRFQVLRTKYAGPCQEEVAQYFSGVRIWDDANFLWSIRDSSRYTRFWL